MYRLRKVRCKRFVVFSVMVGVHREFGWELLTPYRCREAVCLDPGGIAAISPGSRFATRGGLGFIRTDPGGIAAMRNEAGAATPAGVGGPFPVNRWYRFAQPPANGFDPSGINNSSTGEAGHFTEVTDAHPGIGWLHRGGSEALSSRTRYAMLAATRKVSEAECSG